MGQLFTQTHDFHSLPPLSWPSSEAGREVLDLALLAEGLPVHGARDLDAELERVLRACSEEM